MQYHTQMFSMIAPNAIHIIFHLFPTFSQLCVDSHFLAFHCFPLFSGVFHDFSVFFLPPFAQADGLSPVSPARAKVEPEPNLSPPSPKNDVETAADEVTGGNSRAPLLELSPRS